MFLSYFILKKLKCFFFCFVLNSAKMLVRTDKIICSKESEPIVFDLVNEFWNILCRPLNFE